MAIEIVDGSPLKIGGFSIVMLVYQKVGLMDMSSDSNYHYISIGISIDISVSSFICL